MSTENLPAAAISATCADLEPGANLSPCRVIDTAHPLYGQQLEVSASRASRRIGWVRVVLRDGRHRWIPQKATDLEEAACEVGPNRGDPPK